jgi:dipeptidyl aminopeptidase/acylaminoacyl peptidase
VKELEGLDGGWAGYSAAVQAVGNVCGVMDFLDPALAAWPENFPLFGASIQSRPDLAALASPLTHITAQSPPFLHLHGQNDQEVPVSQARRMHAALRSAGVPSELLELDGGHYINSTHQAEVERRLVDFFRQTLSWPQS